MTNKVYGYARISTKKQSIERQVRNISSAFPSAVMVQEAFTGTKIDRPAFSKLLKALRAGDTVVFDSVSRMSRDAIEGYELYHKLYEQGINLVFLKEPHINTDTFRDALNRQIQPTIATGDTNADELLNTITGALNTYMMHLAEKQIQLAFEQSEKEVADLRKRTSEGIQTAKLNGKQVGKEQGTHWETKKAKECKALILKHSKDFNGALNDAECMKLCGIARNSFYKYKKQIFQTH